MPRLAQPQFDQTMKLLEIRRAILDRVYNTRRNRATMQVHESVWMEYSEMLRSGQGTGGPLTEFQRLRLEGQRQEAKARAEYCAEKIEQWQMEIASFKALLHNTDGPPASRRPATAWQRFCARCVPRLLRRRAV